MGVPTTAPKPDNERGFYQKYNITKKDGTKMDPDASYFVLRLDKDDDWGTACREAAKALASALKDKSPQLSIDLYEMLHKKLGEQIAAEAKKL